MAEVSQAQTAHALNRIADSAEVIEYYLYLLTAEKYEDVDVPTPQEFRAKRAQARARGEKSLCSQAP